MNLREIAFHAIETNFEGYVPELDKETKNKYSEIKQGFVVITKKGDLRGEYGELEATFPLWKNIQKNAVKAGFSSKGFSALKKEELKAIKVEVFIVNDLNELKFETEKDLIDNFEIGKGVVLKKGAFEAVALPYVWENIQSKRGFLDELCLKAGLQESDWKKEGVRIWVFDVNGE